MPISVAYGLVAREPLSAIHYTHIDDPHGRIAKGRSDKYLTNDVVIDPQIMDHEWAGGGVGFVAFSGYKFQDTKCEPIGVLALFSKKSVNS